MFIHMLCHICQNLALFLWGVVGEPKFNDLFVFGRPGLVLDSWNSNTTLVAVVSCWYTAGSFGSVTGVTGWTMLFTGFSSNMWAGNWYGSLLIRSLYITLSRLKSGITGWSSNMLSRLKSADGWSGIFWIGTGDMSNPSGLFIAASRFGGNPSRRYLFHIPFH